MKEAVKNVVSTYRKDRIFKANVSLYTSLGINLVYAVFEAINGFVLSSAWMGTLAFYYIVLSVLRFHLIRRKKRTDIKKRWKAYRTCGIVMLFLTIAIAGIHILNITQYYTITYPWYFIYVVALYTFYTAISAVRNIIVYRKVNNPVLSASKAVNLAVAAVSVYNLQSAMISAFGENDESFRVIMSNCVGVGVLVIIVGMAAFMIKKSSGKLSALALSNAQTL